jgi:CO dehydrogenase maturation factor
MTKTIAVAGKGGTGKTTITALLIKYLVENKKGSVLAIDADPSTNLNLALGVPLEETVGDIREETLQEVKGGSSLSGMSKPDYLELRVNQALVEEKGFDLLAMGRPEGPGCYCAANNMLRVCVDHLSKSYDYVVIDNEAGLEHLSRRTTRDVIAAARVAELIHELHTHAGQVGLVVNRVMSGNGDEPQLAPPLQQIIADNSLQLLGLIPQDPTVAEFDALGKPLGRPNTANRSQSKGRSYCDPAKGPILYQSSRGPQADPNAWSGNDHPHGPSRREDDDGSQRDAARPYRAYTLPPSRANRHGLRRPSCATHWRRGADRTEGRFLPRPWRCASQRYLHR